MKDYASMSDEQIAVMVAGLCTIDGVSINEDGMAVRNVVDDSPGSYSGGDYIEFDFDPCNNPEDAWPIIVERKINIEWHEWKNSKWMPFALNNATAKSCYDANPLRAAMIVFLMMKESEND